MESAATFLSACLVVGASIFGVGACSKSASEEAASATAPGQSGPAGTIVAPLVVTSTVLTEGQPMPARFTCDADEVSPPLAWSEPPAGTQSFALVMNDPDASGKTFTHWLVYNLPPSTRSLAEGVKTAPPGALDGNNDFGHVGYGGPCPPSGRHRYVVTVYALDSTLPDLGHPRAAALEKAIAGHVLARGQLVSTYEKGRPKT